jgi:hypothetical protein
MILHILEKWPGNTKAGRALVGKSARTFDTEGTTRFLSGDYGSTPSPVQTVKGPGYFRREIKLLAEF